MEIYLLNFTFNICSTQIIIYPPSDSVAGGRKSERFPIAQNRDWDGSWYGMEIRLLCELAFPLCCYSLNSLYQIQHLIPTGLSGISRLVANSHCFSVFHWKAKRKRFNSGYTRPYIHQREFSLVYDYTRKEELSFCQMEVVDTGSGKFCLRLGAAQKECNL